MSTYLRVDIDHKLSLKTLPCWDNYILEKQTVALNQYQWWIIYAIVEESTKTTVRHNLH